MSPNQIPDNQKEAETVFGNSGDSLSLCLEPFKLYESIVVIKWSDSAKFNAAAMGVRFLDEYSLILNPYPETDTYKILKNSERLEKEDRLRLTVNFTDDVVLFAKAALTGLNSGSSVEELSRDELIKYNDVAYIKNANASILGEVVSVFKDFKVNFSENFSEYNIKKKKIGTKFSAKFEINIIKKFKSDKMFQPTNRGDNLAIEAITLTSKLPPLLNNEKILKKTNEDRIFKTLTRIREYEKEIRRFSASKRAFVVCGMIDDFISKLF
ncbi:MAG: DUF447 domain-containing protein [Promethearchaeota archaeon]